MSYCVQSRIVFFNYFGVFQRGNYQREVSINAINNETVAAFIIHSFRWKEKHKLESQLFNWEIFN